MYFLSINALTRDLKEKKLTEKDDLRYLILFALLALFIPISEFNNSFDFLNAFLMLLFSVSGAIFCFHVNGAGNGQFFLRKFLSISVVIAVRILCFLYLPLFIIALFVDENGAPTSQHIEVLATVLNCLLWAMAFWRISHHLQNVNKAH